jgi:hypothetical protein
MRALVLDCTLKATPQPSNTDALLSVVADALRRDEIEVEVVRVVDHDVKPGVTNDEGDGDEGPRSSNACATRKSWWSPRRPGWVSRRASPSESSNAWTP